MDTPPPFFLSLFFHNLCPFGLFNSFSTDLHLFSIFFSDLSVGEWQQDSTNGNTTRVLSYTIALNNPLGPKTAPVVETQVRQL